MEPIEIQLKHPIPFGEERIGIIKIRRPVARDYRGVRDLDRPISVMLDVIASQNNLPGKVIDEIDGVEDLPRLLEAASGFFEESRATSLS